MRVIHSFRYFSYLFQDRHFRCQSFNVFGCQTFAFDAFYSVFLIAFFMNRFTNDGKRSWSYHLAQLILIGEIGARDFVLNLLCGLFANRITIFWQCRTCRNRNTRCLHSLSTLSILRHVISFTYIFRTTASHGKKPTVRNSLDVCIPPLIIQYLVLHSFSGYLRCRIRIIDVLY